MEAELLRDNRSNQARGEAINGQSEASYWKHLTVNVAYLISC